jgi:hypothetical protein
MTNKIDFTQFGQMPQFGQIFQDAGGPASSIGTAMMETARLSIEHSMKFIQDLANVKQPADAFGLQFAFFNSQAQLLAEQSQAIQREFAKMLHVPGA